MAKEKTASWLCEYANAQLGRPYWMGTYGQIATQELLDYERGRFPQYYTAKDFNKQFGQKVHDCGGLIKACMMVDNVNAAPKRLIVKYDQNAQMMWDSARVKGESMKDFPNIPGYLVYTKDLGHVGVYVGGGLVTEARGHAYGVVQSSISDKRWQKWSDYWAVKYEEQPQPAPTPTPTPTPKPEDDEVKYSDIREVSQGCVGVEVRVVQAVVGVEVDGVFGPITKKAVMAYQEKRGLEVDGIVGPKTWQAIIEVWYR